MQYICIKKLTITCLLGIIGLSMSVQADTLELTTGEIIDGKILSLDSKTVVIYQKPNKIKVNRSKIKKMTFISQDTTGPETKKTVATKTEPKQKTTSEKQVTTSTPKLRPKVEVSSNTEPVKNTTKPLIGMEKKPFNPDQNTNITKNTTQKATSENTKSQTTTEKTIVRNTKDTPVIDYLTYINGSNSQNTYLGIYSNTLSDNNLSIYLPEQTPAQISFKLHAQKNGKIQPLYTAGSVIFADKNGNIISKTNPIVVDEDTFFEWFKNLDNIAGVTGNKNTTIEIPKNTYVIKVLGYRPGSKNNLVGYISNLKLDNKAVSNTNKIK